jgi:hypothetical protein
MEDIMIDRVGICRYISNGPSDGSTYSAFISKHAHRLHPKKFATASKNNSETPFEMVEEP